MDWNFITSPWARLAAAGQLPVSVSGTGDATALGAWDAAHAETTDVAYVPVERAVTYTELDCECGETHRGWTHRGAATAVASGPLNDRLRQAAYSAYRHGAVDCVCGEAHPGWEHREPPRRSEPVGGVRAAIAISDTTEADAAPLAIEAVAATKPRAKSKSATARKAARRRSMSARPRREAIDATRRM
jgi:hypothetical protein